jgi:putative transposase
MKNRKNTRLQNYDYSTEGYYFVTMCTKERINYFGEIEEGKIILNNAGKIVDKCIKEIPEHFSNSEIDYYCVMPNHAHMIIIIYDISAGNSHVGNTHACSHACSLQGASPSKPSNVGNTHACSLPRDKQLLPVIVGSLKSAVSKFIHRLEGNFFFKWQKSYYEHIIRNEKELFEIRKYIESNPMNWESDEDNLINIKVKK